ncbi:MAG: hypothetical protein OXC28_26655 [Defluviicoccus sp.]|nr:hypothetical protein [Defluviicoccus sp.]
MIRARRRSIYCSPVEWAEITERARSAGMKSSPFIIACALAEEEEERPDTVLALTEAEQRTLYDRVALLDRCARAMYERLPGIDLSMFDALAFLERAADLRRKTRE